MRDARTRYLSVPTARWRQSLSERDLATALGQLAVLLDGGVAVTDALQEVAMLESRVRLRRLWTDVARCIEGGMQLSDAIADCGVSQQADVVAVLAAAESDGTLADACKALDEDLHVRVEHRRKMRAALVYPLVAGVSLTLASGFLLWRVVPSVVALAAGQGMLAWHAVPLVWLSEQLQSSSSAIGLALLLMTIVLVGLQGLSGSVLGRRFGLGHTPAAARLFQLASYVDVVRRLRLHGEPLVDAMHVAESCVSACQLREQLVFVRQQLVSGCRLVTALDEATALPGLVRKLVAVGESTGTLDASLERVSLVLRQEAMRRLERIQTFAPVLVLGVVGGLLLWIIVSIVLPVYSIALDSVVLS